MIDFNLPSGLIAQKPASPRGSAQLLVFDRSTGTIIDSVFSDLAQHLEPTTKIVVNNSKVEQCRWLFNDNKTEIFVLEKLDQHTIRALVRPGRKFRLSQKVQLAQEITAQVTEVDNDGLRTLRLNVPHDSPELTKYEHVPLPPYIAQNDSLEQDYQTIYAHPLGSKAAPTAGLHFSSELLHQINDEFGIIDVTLHVGLGTFAQLRPENYASGKLHRERYHITKTNARRLQSAEHITAVGTTSTRTIESFYQTGKTSGNTDIFIQPGYQFQRVDSLITNFHLPGTSLLLMVEAFVGDQSQTQRIYDHAIKHGYRFYSFGDAMLIK